MPKLVQVVKPDNGDRIEFEDGDTGTITEIEYEDIYFVIDNDPTEHEHNCYESDLEWDAENQVWIFT